MKKILLFLLMCLLVAGTALGATAYRYDDVVQTVRGDAVGGAYITVYKADTDTLATLYSGVSTALPAINNPTYSDGYGRFYFYAVAGSYDVVISGPSISSYTKSDVRLFGSALVASEVVNDSGVAGADVGASLDALAALDHDWTGESDNLTTTGTVTADSLVSSNGLTLNGDDTGPTFVAMNHGGSGATFSYEGGEFHFSQPVDFDSYISSDSYILASDDVFVGDDGTGSLYLRAGTAIRLGAAGGDAGSAGNVLTSTGSLVEWAVPGKIIGVDAEAATTTLTAAQSGSLITNTGAAGATVYTLPASVVGYNYKLYAVAGQVITIDPPAGVTVQLGATVGTADTGTLSSNVAGDSLEIICTGATTWVVTRYTAGWDLD